MHKKYKISDRRTTLLSGIDTSRQFCADDFAKRGSMANHESIEDLKLSEEEMEMYVDLHPFTNTSPYTVVETMSLAKALILFREVGLRHLLVIPKLTSVSELNFFSALEGMPLTLKYSVFN
jgi:chloride channel 7